jgi:hypothetical protein
MPTGECNGGWYCTEGSEFAEPTTAGQGGECQADQCVSFFLLAMYCLSFFDMWHLFTSLVSSVFS